MKLSWLIASTIFLILCLSHSAAAADKIKIGLVAPLSGPAASYGNDVKNAILFANEKLTNSAYELIVEDDKCLDREAVSIAHKFIAVDKVKYVLGFACSGTVLASAPVYEAAKVLVIASGAGAPAITNAGDYIFRTKPTLNIGAELLAKEMAAKYEKIGMISEETAYAQGLATAIKNYAAPLNLEVVSENYITGDDDFRTVYLKMKSKGVEALFLNSQAEPTLITMYRQLLDSEWKVPVYGQFLPGSQSFLDTFKEKADGIIYGDVSFNSEMLNEQGLKLFDDFEKKFGKVKSAEHFATLSFISFATLDEALKSGKDVKDYLYGHAFKGISGGYSFDKNGDIVSDKISYVLKTIKNGQIARLDR